MSGPDILANVGRGWKRDPAALAPGTERTGVSAALWTEDQGEIQEAVSDPHPNIHAICIPLNRYYAELYIDGRVSVKGTVDAGRFCLIRAGEKPRGIQRGPWRSLHLYLPDAVLQSALQEHDFDRTGSVELIDPRCGRRDAIVERISREVLHELYEKQPLSRLRIDVLGQDLAIQLLRAHSNLGNARQFSFSIKRGGLPPRRLKSLTDYVEDRLADDISLDDLANVAGLSSVYLVRAFKQAIGATPHRYLVERRIERAKQLLVATDLPLAEVALVCGFANQSHLSTWFRRLVGTTPGRFRAEL